MSDKIFIGSAKIITTKYGELTKGSMSVSDLEKALEYAKNNNGWVNFLLKEKQNKEKDKPTHYMEIDQWKPEPGSSWNSPEVAKVGKKEWKPKPQSNEPVAVPNNESQDLPF